MNQSRHGAGRQADGIAIIGMDCLFPRAGNLTGFWRSIRRGEDGITEVPETHWRPEDYYDPDPKRPDMTYCTRGGFLSPVAFDPTEFGIPPTILEATDTTQLLSLVVAKRALEDAGYGENRDFNRDGVSVIIGVTGTQELALPLTARLGHPRWRRALNEAGVEPEVAEQIIQRVADSYVGWQENSFPGLLGNVVAGRIANRLNLRGTNCVVDAACASSLGAVHLAMMELATGRCEMALAGGADTLNDIFMYMCFSKTPALSPTGDARPFSDAADGTVLGEGVGLVVLKRLADAQRDGDRIYAVLKAIGTSSDGRSQSIYAPHSAGQARALRTAYRQAGFSPSTVQLIEAHGTGTKVGDQAEFDALKTVFREARPQGAWCALGAIKSQIGHTKAAAGVAGLIKASLAIHYKTLPPTIKIDKPNAGMKISKSPFYLSTEMRPWLPRSGESRRAGVSAFGFGGSNFHAVLEEHQAAIPAVSWDGTVQIIALSAQSPDELQSQLDQWLERVADQRFDEDVLAYHAAESRRTFSAKHPARLVIVVEIPVSPTLSDSVSGQMNHRRDAGATEANETRATLRRLLEQAAAGLISRLAAPRREAWGGPDSMADHQAREGIHGPATGSIGIPPVVQHGASRDIYFGDGAAAGKLALLFPGQGSQYVGMGCELACTFPEVLAAFAAAEEAVDDPKERLSEFVYPRPSFDTELRRQQSHGLTRTEIAQPVIGALSIGMHHVLQRFGIKPDMTAGHSYGELPAIAASGRIDETTLHRLSRLRGRLMAEGDSNRGTMLAVRASLADLTDMLDEEKLDLVIANRNTPTQQVLSGSRSKIGQAAEACKRRGWAVTPLRVSGAFHSTLMQDALPPFRNALEAIEFQPAVAPAFANTTAAAYPQEATETRRLLAEQLVKPVDFVGVIDNMYLAGARSFVEVGPRAVLCGLVKEILGDRPHAAVAMDVSAGRRSAMIDLARLLAQLAARGHDVDLSKWERPAAEPRTARMVVPLVGANYRSTAKDHPQAQPVGVKPQTQQREMKELRDTIEEPRALCKARAAYQTGRALPPSQVTAPHKTPQERIEASRNGIEEPRALCKSRAANQAEDDILSPQFSTKNAPPASSAPDPSTTKTSPPSRSPLATNPSVLPEAVRVIQQGLQAMQRLQQETADAHRRFLEGQEMAHQTMQRLLEQQQHVLGASIGLDATSPSEQPHADVSRPFVPAQPQESIAVSAAEPISALSRREEQAASQAAVSVKRQGPAADEANQSQQTALSESELAATQSDGGRQIESLIVEVVCEKTGYPADMIDLDMDIEADLGVDSIKRVEIIAALEERIPDFQGVQPDHIGSIRTLRQIADFISAAAGESTALPSVGEPAASADVETENISADAFAETLLQVVSELTGYPGEMLELDMDMEADLGIDSIKRVEILSAVEGRVPDLPPVKPEFMGSLRTLRQIVEYCTGQTDGDAKSESQAKNHDADCCASRAGEADVPARHASSRRADSPEPQDAAEDFDLNRRVLRVVQLPDAPPGRLAVAPGREIWVTDDGTGLAEAIMLRLQEAGHSARLVLPAAAAEVGDAAIGGLIHVAPLPTGPSSGPGLQPVRWRDKDAPLWNVETEAMLKTAFAITRGSAPSLLRAASDGGALLVTISRMDGAFGLLGENFDPAQGGLAGLAKTAAREWEQVNCRALDVSWEWQDHSAAADAVVRELQTAGPMEVGLDESGRRGLVLQPDAPIQSQSPLVSEDVVVISGGARGVTVEAALTLARRQSPVLVLLGRTQLEDQEPDWLAELTSEREMKAAIRKNAFAGGPKPSPKVLKQTFKNYMAQREIRGNIDRLSAAGSAVSYYSVDVCDESAVCEVMNDVQKRMGPIRGLIHGAGVIQDSLLQNKTPEQFDRVFDTKVGGLRSLLKAVAMDELKHIVLFSSVSGRCGNRGQVDYAMANEVLNKVAHRLAARLPACRVVSLNWGPWDGGMVHPILRREFRNLGIDLIPLEAGGACVADEMFNAPGAAKEVILGSTLDQASETDVPDASPTDRQAVSSPLTPAFDRRLDLPGHSFLRSHVIDGRSVLPTSMIAEWLGHAALHANPGLMLRGLDELRILKGIVLDRGPIDLRFFSTPPRRSGEVFDVDVEVRSNDKEDSELLHARATVVLSSQPAAGPTFDMPDGLVDRPYERGLESAYRDILFHGEHLRCIERVMGFSQRGMVAEVRCADEPGAWMAEPLRSSWLIDPLALDGAFQLAILWCHEEMGAVCLPTYLCRYRQYRSFPAGCVKVVLQLKSREPHKMVGDFSFVLPDGHLIAHIDGYEATVDASLMAAFRRGRRMDAASS